MKKLLLSVLIVSVLGISGCYGTGHPSGAGVNMDTRHWDDRVR